MQEEARPPGSATGYFIRQGALSGISAGISFLLYAMLMAWLLDGDIFKPLRMMATVTLGENALARWNSLLAVAIHGIFILGVFTMGFGALFGHMISRRQYVTISPRRLILAGSLYGCCVWLGSHYIVAPLFGWIWFPLENNFVLEGFIGHTFFFGAGLGFWFARSLQTRE